eukprot:3835484-Rhodomonas_salina.1
MQEEFTLRDCLVEFTPGADGAGWEQEGLEPKGLVVDLKEPEEFLAMVICDSVSVSQLVSSLFNVHNAMVAQAQ